MLKHLAIISIISLCGALAADTAKAQVANSNYFCAALQSNLAQARRACNIQTRQNTTNAAPGPQTDCQGEVDRMRELRDQLGCTNN